MASGAARSGASEARPREPSAHVAVVVLSWNGRDDTLACLESLAEVRWWGPLTTIVVDNGSTDGTADAVKGRFPDAHLIRNRQNLGFAGGNNVGLRRALELGADYVLLLNNDTVVDPGLLVELVAEAERCPDAAGLCPLVYYAEPPDVIWYAGAMFDPRRGYNDRHLGYGERDTGRYAGVRAVTQATGAALLIPRPALERVGLLADDLFLHVEDTEWSLRARRAGYRLYVVPRAKIWHKVSRDTGGEHSPALAYYGTRNRLEVSRRHAPLNGLPALRREAVTVAAELLHARRAERPLENARAVIEGWRDYRGGRLGPRRGGARR
jgi:GT2 family glycosyltransferase